MPCDYTVEEGRLKVNCIGCMHELSIENSEICMSNTIKKLIEAKNVTKIVLSGYREYEYDWPQVKLLLEIANAIQTIERKRIISLDNISIPGCDRCVDQRLGKLQYILTSLAYDPLDAYRTLIREIRHASVKKNRTLEKCRKCYENYINNALIPIKSILENCELIKMGEKYLSVKGREFYREVFSPSIRPNFMYTRYQLLIPKDAELVYKYMVGNNEVKILKIPNHTRFLYHITPVEFTLSEEEYLILDMARRYLASHRPRRAELAEPEETRNIFFSISRDIIKDVAERNKVSLSGEKLNELAEILVRYTAGFGILELLLMDEHIQDISINSPVGTTPIFVYHSDFENCETNLIPSIEDANMWATRFRLISGRPLDEANPVLDTEIITPGGRARVCAITRTLSPTGLGFALRRHRERPWTYPLFIKNRYMNALSAGLLWFLIDNARTMLIAGTRSSGKTSLLGASMLQIMPRLRIITCEDTIELPVTKLRELGYDIEQLKSRSVITRVETELPADDALRTALRLGDSCLIVGEVRSVEAKALWEAMRIGALANVVAGTIHGDSPYGVFDRVVNDLGVPPTSFKATDIIVIANRLRSPDGLRAYRRLTTITEVRKHWKHDPLDEGGFVTLMEYSAKEDEMKPTQTLLIGESFILNEIASMVREWKGNWELVWENINLRANVLGKIAELSNSIPEIAEAEHVLKSNQVFHIICDEVNKEVGMLDSKIIFERWFEWIKNYIKEQMKK
ncbi:MAG: type II/IV secretion system ATPase subunit [Candidatus Aenigmatarchaeota archaeon]|nr:type II/IV secretion system ATPase subunit [Candidatus Aenigmarchaeota archaeon]